MNCLCILIYLKLQRKKQNVGRLTLEEILLGLFFSLGEEYSIVTG